MPARFRARISWPRGVSAWDAFAAAPGWWRVLLEDPLAPEGAVLAGPGRSFRFGPADGARFARALARLARGFAPADAPPRAIVYLAYEAGGWFERLPAPKTDPGPWAWLLVPEVVARWRDARTVEVAATGPKALARAVARLRRARRRRLRAPCPAPEPSWTPSEADYMQAVRRAREWIAAGDIFQANIARFFSLPYPGGRLPALYAALRARNPAPFGGIARLARDFWLLSSSPELLVAADGSGRVRARPIAGTRRRGREFEDARLARELLLDAKERAEHVMLVDLVRNDLGRVAATGSVRVAELFTLERYATVQHIVSEVQARMGAGADAARLVRAVFPGGTITGCPKVRAMEIIHALEPCARGPYTGALGWVGPRGRLCLDILIRTLWWRNGRLFGAAGAGIVADSDPARELAECAHKAAGMLRALRPGPVRPQRSRGVWRARARGGWCGKSRGVAAD